MSDNARSVADAIIRESIYDDFSSHVVSFHKNYRWRHLRGWKWRVSEHQSNFNYHDYVIILNHVMDPESANVGRGGRSKLLSIYCGFESCFFVMQCTGRLLLDIDWSLASLLDLDLWISYNMPRINHYWLESSTETCENKKERMHLIVLSWTPKVIMCGTRHPPAQHTMSTQVAESPQIIFEIYHFWWFQGCWSIYFRKGSSENQFTW